MCFLMIHSHTDIYIKFVGQKSKLAVCIVTDLVPVVSQFVGQESLHIAYFILYSFSNKTLKSWSVH